MKLRPIAAFLVFSWGFACSEKEPNHHFLKIKGSESMHETFLALKSDFEKMQDSISVELEGGGRRTGMIGEKEGNADIGLSSYAFELDSILGVNHGIEARVVAFDGIVLISNEQNPIEQLTREQIAGIFNGAFSDWAELGGSAGEIVPVIRDENSGTQRFFTNYFGIEELGGNA